MSDDARRIVSVWESPMNEGAAYYKLGVRVFDYGVAWDRKHGANGYPTKCIVANIERMEYDEGFRIDVYGEDGKLWVSLPAQACGWEYGEVSDE